MICSGIPAFNSKLLNEWRRVRTIAICALKTSVPIVACLICLGCEVAPTEVPINSTAIQRIQPRQSADEIVKILGIPSAIGRATQTSENDYVFSQIADGDEWKTCQSRVEWLYQTSSGTDLLLTFSESGHLVKHWECKVWAKAN